MNSTNKARSRSSPTGALDSRRFDLDSSFLSYPYLARQKLRTVINRHLIILNVFFAMHSCWVGCEWTHDFDRQRSLVAANNIVLCRVLFRIVCVRLSLMRQTASQRTGPQMTANNNRGLPDPTFQASVHTYVRTCKLLSIRTSRKTKWCQNSFHNR